MQEIDAQAMVEGAMTESSAINLEIVGKGVEVVKMQKRLRCAARATNTDIHLSWRHDRPEDVFGNTSLPVAVLFDGELLIDGLRPTEEIEKLLLTLKEENEDGA